MIRYCTLRCFSSEGTLTVLYVGVNLRRSIFWEDKGQTPTIHHQSAYNIVEAMSATILDPTPRLLHLASTLIANFTPTSNLSPNVASALLEELSELDKSAYMDVSTLFFPGEPSELTDHRSKRGNCFAQPKLHSKPRSAQTTPFRSSVAPSPHLLSLNLYTALPKPLTILPSLVSLPKSKNSL